MMKATKPIVILHGDDEAALEESLAAICAAQEATGMADFNFARFDGKSISQEAFSNAVFALPFMQPTRVVVLKNPLSLAGGREGNQKFLSLLDSVPSSTELYLVLPDKIERRDWASLGKTSFLRKWVDKHPEKAEIITHALPKQDQMPGWILKKAQAMGGSIERPAAKALADQIGNDTQQVTHELEKLLLFVNYERPIDTNDVQDLISGTVLVSIFDMVDALVTGNASEALRKLHLLMDEQEIPALYGMITRQFRLLLQTREIMNQRGGAANVQAELDQVPFVANKLLNQASAFSFASLKKLYKKLVDLDYGFKTSQIDPKAALDTFVVEVSLKARD